MKARRFDDCFDPKPRWVHWHRRIMRSEWRDVYRFLGKWGFMLVAVVTSAVNVYMGFRASDNIDRLSALDDIYQQGSVGIGSGLQTPLDIFTDTLYSDSVTLWGGSGTVYLYSDTVQYWGSSWSVDSVWSIGPQDSTWITISPYDPDSSIQFGAYDNPYPAIADTFMGMSLEEFYKFMEEYLQKNPQPVIPGLESWNRKKKI